jgi:hypothetical protein
MKTLAIRKSHFRAFLLIILGIVVMWSLPVKAAQDGSEGEEWMKWDNNTRRVYVRAYVQGSMNGFNRGCDDGVSSAQPNAQGEAVLRFMTACLSRSPISQRDSMKMVDQITDFYTRYPAQRFLDISDVLLGLHAGLTRDQIHEHYVGVRR